MMTAAPHLATRVGSAVVAVACLWAGSCRAQAGEAPSRGQLLYETHCIACHTTQMHWRESKAARDWPGLRRLVRRWQGELQLRWTDRDIDEVARFLNRRYYQYPEPGPTMTRGKAAAPLS